MYLDDGRDELLEEAGELEEGGPEVVQQVDQQPLDVAPCVCLGRNGVAGCGLV